jgi:hypothetical protein
MLVTALVESAKIGRDINFIAACPVVPRDAFRGWIVDNENHYRRDSTMESRDSSVAYAEAAEFIDLAMAEPWQSLGPRVREVLAAAPVRDQPLVDIGAGTGRGVLAAGRALPQAPVVALEPSAPMRAVLLSRISGDLDLLARTTVVPTSLSQALDGTRAAHRLPQVWGAALALGMTGHLEPEERRGFFHVAARRLVPGAPLLVSVQPPRRVEAVPEMEWSAVHVGAHTYSTSGRAEPEGPGSVIWHITYRVHEKGRLLREVRMSHRWHVHDAADVLAEMRVAGLEPELLGHDLVRGLRPS